MLPSMTSLLPTAIVYLTTYLLHSTLLLGTTWLIVRGLRIKSHVLTERLWKLAAVGSLVTVPLQLELDLSRPVVTVALESKAESLAHHSGRRDADSSDIELDRHVESREPTTRWPDEEPAAPETIRLTPNTYGDPALDDPALDDPALDDPALDDAREPATEFHAASPMVGMATLANLLVAFFSLFVVVAILGVLKMACDSLAFRRRMSRTQTLRTGTARTTLDRLLGQRSVRRSVQLLTSPDCNEPAAFGVWQWRIVLPEQIERRLRADELAALLAHELAHLVRGDTIWLWIGRLLCSCGAFQPLNFLARREWRRAAEYRCDDWAVQHGISGLSLASCLTRVAAWKNSRESCNVSLAAGGTTSSISDRVERLVEADAHKISTSKRFGCHIIWWTALAATIALPCWAPRAALFAQADSLADVTHGEASAVERATLEDVDTVEHRSQTQHHSEDEALLWREIRGDASDLNTELQTLERHVQELAEQLNGSEATPDVLALLEQMRVKLGELNQRRAMLDELGHIDED